MRWHALARANGQGQSRHSEFPGESRSPRRYLRARERHIAETFSDLCRGDVTFVTP